MTEIELTPGIMCSASSVEMEYREQPTGQGGEETQPTGQRGEETQSGVHRPGSWHKWFILTISVIINVIVTGIAFSFGILFVELLDEFKQGKGPTAAVGSISIGILFGVGPIAGIFTKRFGSRLVAIFGAMLTFVGLLTTAYANSLAALYGLYSVMTGIGFGCLNLTAILCVTEHFKKRQGLACAISSSGCGLGNVIFPIILSKLIASVGWRHMMSILAGIQIITVLCSFLMFPNSNKSNTFCGCKKESIKRRTSTLFDFSLYPNISTALRKVWITGIFNNKISDRNTLVSSSTNALDSNIEYSQFSNSSPSNLDVPMDIQLYDEKCKDSKSGISQHSNYNVDQSPSVDDSQYYSHNNKIHSLNKNQNKTTQDIVEVNSRLKQRISKYLCDVSIFKNTKYSVFFISCLLSGTGAGVPSIIISDYAGSFGTTPGRSAILVSVIGITGTIGRLLAGAASCHPQINILALYTATMALSGIATLLIPIIPQFWFCMLCSSLFGLFYGVTAGLDPTLLAQFVGMENIAIAFGYFTLALGVGSTVSSPLAGFLRDSTETYNVSFYVAGVLLVLSSVSLLPMTMMSRLRQKRLQVIDTPQCITLTGYNIMH